MSRFFHVSLTFILIFILLDCNKDPNNLDNLNEKEILKKADEFYQKKEIQKTVECFQTFLNKFPKSNEAPAVLKNLAAIYGTELKDLNNAIVQYKRIINDFPDSKECPNAMFTIAFIYNNDLKDYSQARTYYEMFLQKYPTHEAASSAKFELDNLGKSTEEILNKIAKPEVVTTPK